MNTENCEKKNCIFMEKANKLDNQINRLELERYKEFVA